MLVDYEPGRIIGYKIFLENGQDAFPIKGRFFYAGPFVVFSIRPFEINEVTVTDFLNIFDDAVEAVVIRISVLQDALSIIYDVSLPQKTNVRLLTDDLAEISDFIHKNVTKTLDDSIIIDDAITTQLLQRIAKTLTDFMSMNDHIEEQYIPAVYIWFLKGGVKIEIKGH